MPTNSAQLRAENDALFARGLKRCPHADCPAKGEPQPVDGFYRKATTRDRLTCWCKVCCIRNTARTGAAYRASEAGKATRQRCYERRQAEGRDLMARARYRDTAKYREWLAAYQSRPDRKAKVSALQARDRAKRGARAVVNNAIAEGRFAKADTHPCQICGRPAAEYHHHKGYDPEFVMDVQPLCVECHRLIDLRERADAQLVARSALRALSSGSAAATAHHSTGACAS